MRPTPLDELPVHQVPLPMARVATSDRHFYDRCYLNAHDRTGDIFLVTGLGTYPNLGVRDAYACVRVGDLQHVVRFSDALDQRSTEQQVGPYRIEVIEPLERLRLVLDHPTIGLDLVWEGSFPAMLEQPHLLLGPSRPTLDAQRFAQVGTWSGTLSVAGTDHTVSPDTWVGTRDRSWGVRPVGDPDPAGRAADEPMEGFWWLYAPLRFDDFALVVILQESPDGFRTLNDATRVFPDGRVEQLGWPRVEIDYRPGSRHPLGARLHLTTPAGDQLLVEVETRGFVPLHVGCGYGGDSEWGHGQWRGRGWSSASTYDLASEEMMARIPWGVSDHVARATCGDAVGHGLFEHACMGRHDPSGFADWSSLA
ncbi:hypothetical protein [Nocardioides sp.]|uniref:hypothetical protein n=1 Tax=Nocardioides sp. TaxID=35761 RepID=UPI0027375121|nr:hypothetical protein [Nocardioides sp.]MDP3894795.1 hypothetical protein [Nocardioides sp.]